MIGKYPIIALCIARVEEEHNFNFLKSLSERCVERGCRLLVYQTCSDLYWRARPGEGDRAVFSLMDFKVIDLVIVFSEVINDQEFVDGLIKRCQDAGKPVFSIGIAKEGCCNFFFNYVDGIEKTTRHIIEDHSVNDICYMSGPKGEPISEKRLAKFRSVLAEYAIPFDDTKLYYGEYWWRPTEAAMNDLLAKGHIPEAVVCANDSMAITVCEKFKAAGYKVPEDVLVTGFDGIVEGQINYPTITSSNCDMDEMTISILDAFDDYRKGTLDLHDRVISRFTLIPGMSCGCCKDYDVERPISYYRSQRARRDRYLFDSTEFHVMYEKALNVPSIGEFGKDLSGLEIKSAAIVLNESCFSENINPLSIERAKDFDDTVVVIMQEGRDESVLPVRIRREQVMMDWEDIVAREKPVVFASLSLFGHAAGYLAFFTEVDIELYFAIHYYTKSMNEIIGGYWLVNHMRYNIRQMDRMAMHDYMTDMYNRNGFYPAMRRILGRAPGRCCLLASIDMDGLKYINDNFGHEHGDQAILLLSEALMSVNLEGKICGRFGGDEFVLCAIVDADYDVSLVEKQIRAFLDTVNDSGFYPFRLGASVGCVLEKVEGFDFDKVLKQTDELMYEQKRKRKESRK